MARNTGSPSAELADRLPPKRGIDLLAAGHPSDHFLGEFPSVTREHAIAVLELAPQPSTTLLGDAAIGLGALADRGT